MRITDINRHSHIDNIVRYPCYTVRAASLTLSRTFQKRQKGGIANEAYDHKQKDIRAFFGGNRELLPDSDNSPQDEVTDMEGIIE